MFLKFFTAENNPDNRFIVSYLLLIKEVKQMQISFLDQASLWGQVFEIAVKRGVLQKLIHEKLLINNHPIVQHWQNFKNAAIKNHLIKSLKLTKDENSQAWVESMVRHLLVLGYGLGWTTMRECLKQTPVSKLKLEAIWCPLVFPGEVQKPDIEPEKTAQEFKQAFNLTGNPDLGLVEKGKPARADFLLWLSPDENSTTKKRDHFIFCFEFSYNVPSKLADFSHENAHREEVSRYARYIDSRGVFSRVCAEVEGEEFSISEKIKNHLLPFSGSDKPLYKLCQASSYTERLIHLLKTKGKLEGACIARAIAITSNGCESIAANFNDQPDTRIELMKSLGEAYRKFSKPEDNIPDYLNKEILAVFKRLVQSLPGDFSKQAKQLIPEPNLETNISYRFEENIEEFYNSNQEVSRENIILAVEETEALHKFFNGNPQDHFIKELPQTERIQLRKVHESAVIASLKSAQTGKINVIALEGNPGIGKTTAVVKFLEKQSEGFMFLYISPRVVINRDVTDKLAKNNGNYSGIATLTTNANLINLAPKWYKENFNSKRFIDSAVVFDGVENLNLPDGNTIFITPAQEHEIDAKIVSATKAKNALNERDYKIESIHRPGVLKTLATSARKLLEVNPKINQLVITAATQGYRSLDNKTTINALEELFKSKADSKPGIRERSDFSQRIPTIIVMVDEVTGDGAGALFVHKLEEWLHKQFIEYFQGKSPFKVILIMADASLSNEVILNNYLSHNKAPDKVLLSKSRGNEPFRMTGTNVKVGLRKYPTVHIMTNSYPASQLTIEYSMQLAKVTPGLAKDGRKQTIRQAIRGKLDAENLNNAYKEIANGLKEGAEQLIFFAQDKAFLRQLRSRLIEGKDALCKSEDVAILDHSILPHERLELVKENTRDKKRVFLMTSSGARGVSFPKTDWIIATIPRFNIESALMEVAQLIYRGRGMYTDSETGLQVSGDNKNRRLVMLINDCIIKDDIEDNTEDKKRDFTRRWLRQSSDLLTLLMMLRSTIYTRIKGDAGLKKQKIAFVPVGSIGDEELLHLMSDDLQSFLQEARVFIYDDHSDDHKGTVKKTQQLIEEIFANFKLEGRAPDRNTRSYIEYHTLEAFVQVVSKNSSQLLPSLENTDLIIPENLTCIGTFWIEDWGKRKIGETFTFEGWRKNTGRKIDELLSKLWVICNEKSDFPPKLKHPARELYIILKQEKEALTQEYSTLQNLQTENIIVSIPLDYPHFWHKQELDTPKQRLEDPESWQKSLGKTLTPQGLVMPVIAKYDGIPWVAVAGRKVFDQLETTFSDRYFMISSELNLLNTILLEDNL